VLAKQTDQLVELPRRMANRVDHPRRRVRRENAE
jgi:hypothetical protein